MSDLISRQNAIEGVKELFACADIGNDECDIIYMLENLPSADRPTGVWTEDGVCSNCGRSSGTQFDGVQPIPLKTKFCPNCGAKMMTGNVIR